jgi:nucleotide-binding universal stress UspA family protein
VQAMSGSAAEELIKASHDSDLVVVSARGGGAFARLAIGEVSTKATHHAVCPACRGADGQVDPPGTHII